MSGPRAVTTIFGTLGCDLSSFCNISGHGFERAVDIDQQNFRARNRQ